MNRWKLENIHTDFILTDDDTFRVSRKLFSPDLQKSIEVSGMMEIPCLVKDGKGFVPLTCHNRLSVLKNIRPGQVRAFVLDEPDSEIFQKNLALKVFRKETGPIGKIRALKIFRDVFHADMKGLEDFFKSVLNIPEYILTGSGEPEKLLQLPENLSDYIDSRDQGYRLIRDITELSGDVLGLMDGWVSSFPVRVNIFKKLVDYLFDIERRDGPGCPDDLQGAVFSSDAELVFRIFHIRYPSYSGMREQVSGLVDDLSGGRVSVDFPEYFERNSFSVRIEVGKKDRPDNIAERFGKINIEKICSLQKLL